MRALGDAATRWGLWLDGVERADPDRGVRPSISPWDGRLLADVEQATDSDVEDAVASAQTAYVSHRRTPGHERARWLHGAADALADVVEPLARTIVDLLGKPIRSSRFEVGRGVQLLRLCAEEISRLGGENLPLDAVEGGEGRWGLTRRESFGVVAAVTPFNAPVNLMLQKVAPALATGNAVVVKPAPEAAVVALQIAEVVASALPPGLLSVLPGGPEVAIRLAADRQVRVVSLTGGVAAGEAVLAAAGVKPVLLELGSNAPNIVCADADLDDAATRIAAAAFGASGQQCISAQRVIVERSVFEEFAGLFAAAAGRMQIGDPHDPGTEIGPLVHERRRDAVVRFIEDAVSRGAGLVLDGRREDLCFGPTVLRDAAADALICTEEVFGPVAVLIPADSLDHAVEIANDSPFGLQAACFTSDLGAAMWVAEELRSGAVWINDSTRFRLDTYPFGGFGQSGIGREGVRSAMEAFSQVKFIGIRRQ